MIYSDRQGAIYKLSNDKKYEMICEVWKEGRLIAALFSSTRRSDDGR
ncbi:hypothetical protein QF028_003514 [Neobacillus sp. B4I6]